MEGAEPVEEAMGLQVTTDGCTDLGGVVPAWSPGGMGSEFMVIIGYISRLRPDWTTGDPVSKYK